MTGDDLKLDGTRQDFDTTTGEPIVTMQFTNDGGDKFGEITNREADRGTRLPQHHGRQGNPRTPSSTSRSCSTARSSRGRRSTSSSTRTGSAARTAPRSRDSSDLGEAQDLALVLQSGALPVTFKTLETTAISATARQGLAPRGLEGRDRRPVVVALFLLVFYRVLGVVAVIGLSSTPRSCTRRSCSSTSP